MHELRVRRRLGHSRRGRDGNDRMSFEEQQPTLIDLVIRRNLCRPSFPLTDSVGNTQLADCESGCRLTFCYLFA